MQNAEAFFSGFTAAQTSFSAALRNGRQYMVAGATHDSLLGSDSAQVVEQLRIFWRDVRHGRR
jgi:hypothetical protein